MSGIEVSHRGYRIRFNENSDEWFCPELSGKKYSAPKLSTIKASIDRMLLDVRKAASIDCFEISGAYHRRASKTPSKIVEFVETKWKQRSFSGGEQGPEHIVAVVAKRQGSEKASRREVVIGDLMPDTPEAHEAFARFEAACAREREAHEQTQAAYKAIPRVTIDMIGELVAIAERGRE